MDWGAGHVNQEIVRNAGGVWRRSRPRRLALGFDAAAGGW